MEKKINGKPIDKSRKKKVVCCCKKEIYKGNLSLYSGNIIMLFMTSNKT